MQRRKFINYVGLGAIASYLPIALVACAENNTITETEDSAAPGLFTVGTVTELEKSGFLLDEESEVMVVRDRAGKLIAVNPTCTHQGCTVEWQNNTSTFLCPCHAAKYAPDGEVLAQPAPSPLSTYEVVADGEEVLVKI